MKSSHLPELLQFRSAVCSLRTTHPQLQLFLQVSAVRHSQLLLLLLRYRCKRWLLLPELLELLSLLTPIEALLVLLISPSEDAHGFFGSSRESVEEGGLDDFDNVPSACVDASGKAGGEARGVGGSVDGSASSAGGTGSTGGVEGTSSSTIATAGAGVLLDKSLSIAV